MAEFDKQCNLNMRAAKAMNKKDSQCFTVKEVKEMHRFFFEKEDKQLFESEISLPV